MGTPRTGRNVVSHIPRRIERAICLLLEGGGRKTSGRRRARSGSHDRERRRRELGERRRVGTRTLCSSAMASGESIVSSGLRLRRSQWRARADAEARRTKRRPLRCFFVPSSTFDDSRTRAQSKSFVKYFDKKSRLIRCAAQKVAPSQPSAPSLGNSSSAFSRRSLVPCATRSVGRRHFPERGSRTSGFHFARNTPRTLRDVSPGGRDRARGASSSHRRATLLRRLGGSDSEESTRCSGRSDLRARLRRQSPARIAPRTVSRRGEDLDGRRKAEGGGDDGSDHGGAPRPAASHLDRSF